MQQETDRSWWLVIPHLVESKDMMLDMLAMKKMSDIENKFL